MPWHEIKTDSEREKKKTTAENKGNKMELKKKTARYQDMQFNMILFRLYTIFKST